MARRVRSSGVVAVVVSAIASSVATVASLATGCGSNGVSTTSPLAECLPTLALANGSACADGLVCPYESLCGSLQQQTNCTCANSVLVCVVAGTDMALSPGTEPACSPLLTSPGCPNKEPVGLSACSTIGLSCLYAGIACPDANDSGVLVDTCRCQSGDDGGLVYSCAIAECTATGGDAGDASAVGDGASAPNDAGDSGAGSDATDSSAATDGAGDSGDVDGGDVG